MARVVSLLVLIACLIVLGLLFYQVIAGFILPLFIAVVLTVTFRPLHENIKRKCRGRDRIAAALTTAAILVIVLMPLVLLIFRGISEGKALYDSANAARADGDPSAEAGHFQQQLDKALKFAEGIGVHIDVKDIQQRFSENIPKYVEFTAQLTGGILLGLIVTAISLYYFLADGPNLLTSLKQLAPVDARHVENLTTEFGRICRAVVTATLASAVVQGLLVGLGFYFAGAGMVFLLTLLTMLFSMVPVVGSSLVWGPVCLWMFFIDDRHGAAVALLVYCAVIVVTIENLVKPAVLHGQSNMHPLLAFLSVLGGASALGPVGIFVGPMVVAFLHTLLKILHLELQQRPAEKPPAAGEAEVPR